MKISINTTLEINSLENLKNLKQIMEVNKLGEPNYSQIARELGVDRRTAKKYYDGNINNIRKKKHSKFDKYADIIDNLLLNTTGKSNPIFYYKDHLYRYLVREHGLKGSRSNFNRYISLNTKYSEYFDPKDKPDAIKSETEFAKQAQFDWKEKLNYYFKDGSNITINVGSLILSASRLKVWMIYCSTSQECLFDFISRAFETIGGVPKELIIDNAKTMMDEARTECKEGRINSKFEQLSKDYGFKIKPCVRARPKTKAKVENPMRVIDEIMNYNGQLSNLNELYDKLKLINDEANSRICQATGLPPILVYQKEKEHLSPLPSEKVCSSYKIKSQIVKINTDSLFMYKQNKYSVSPKLIGKTVSIQVIENNLYVYYNKNLITVHIISKDKTNYYEEHHRELVGITFPRMEEEEIKEYSLNHLKELEVYSEQLQEVTG